MRPSEVSDALSSRAVVYGRKSSAVFLTDLVKSPPV
jgi:hypothetical protein